MSERFLMKLRPFVLRRDVRNRLAECVQRHLNPSDTIYDIGCGARPFFDIISGIGAKYIGIDLRAGFYQEDILDIIGEATAIPVREGMADAVLSSQVIEHLPAPETAISEASRILKPRGLLFVSFPFLYPLHAAPFDFFRYTRYSFESMCKRHGLEIDEEHCLGGFWYMSSIFCGIHFGSLDSSVFRGLPVLSILSLPFHWLCWVLHESEGLLYRLARKDVDDQRRSWTVNFVYVARRIGTPPPLKTKKRPLT